MRIRKCRTVSRLCCARLAADTGAWLEAAADRQVKAQDTGCHFLLLDRVPLGF